MRLPGAVWVLNAAVGFMALPSAAPAQQGDTFEPFRVIGNIYYVGAQYGSYLITTPEGHVLLDTGTSDMHDLIVSNIEKLGFKVRDVRIMISSHTHWDHVEGHAQMKRATGAQVVALGGDAVALATGHDNSALGARGWEPVVVDRVIQDGDSVTLGGVTLRALWTGGHTQGATMWITTVQENGRHYTVGFRGGEIPNDGVQLHDNPRYPSVVADTRRTLERLERFDSLDVFLHNHPRNIRSVFDPGFPVNPRCVTCLDRAQWRSYVARMKTSFAAMLAADSGSG